MVSVTLESQLETYAKEVPEQYAALLTTWRQNKQRCESLLSSVSENFMYYSSHSAEHSQMVIRNIERILDDSRIQLLSATDIWLLLHSAYMHDLGMVIPYKDYEQVWTLPEFERFLKDNLHSDNSDLREASQFLIEFLGKNEKKEMREKRERSETFRNSDNKLEPRIVEDWPIVYRSSTTILISEYFRPKHADRIAEYVDNSSKYHMSFDILNNRRIVNLIKRISCLHTRDSKELISTLEQETVGFGRDIAHPRFIAELLRLGDALDLDAGRFSIDFTFLHGRRPEYSELHYKLHNAVTDFLIKPEKVCYRADCPDRDTYRLVCQLTRYLEEEFRFCASNWPKIVPDNFPGPVPQFVLSSEDVKIKGKSDDMGLTGLCFTLSEKKAFQLLEGANIYNNSMTFVRELLQNALDATKIQFWRDLRTRYDYRRRLSPDATKAVLENPQNLQPYDIPPDLYENYPVEILVRNITSPCEDGTQTSDETAEILFIDHGTGFIVDTVKRMCRVTESYSGSEFVRELDNMPKWLRPTGGFGIGLQSVFNMADTIFVETQSEQEPPMSIEIDSPQKGGTVRVEIHEGKAEISKDNMEQYPDGRGTVMRICLKGKPKEFFDTNLLQPCVTHYDKQLYNQIAFLIKSYCSSPLFPITVKWNNECCSPKGKNFHQLFLEELPGYDNLKHREHYCYRLSKDGTQIEIWDMEGAWLAHWELAHARYLASIMFKGMNIQNVPPLANNLYALCSMDAYGLDANRHLQLDRDSLTTEGKRVFETAIQKTAKLYMEILWDKFQKNPNAPKFLMRDNDNSYRLDFWMSTETKVRKELAEKHSAWFQNAELIAQCLMFKPRISIQYIPIQEYIVHYALWPRIAIDKIEPLPDNDKVQSCLRQMGTPYDETERILSSKIIKGDDDNLSTYNINDLPELRENIAAVCMTPIGMILFPTNFVNKSSANLLRVNPSARRTMMRDIGICPKRCYFPILSEYKLLAFDMQDELKALSPVGFGFEFPNSKIIISPVTYKDFDTLKKKSREDFQKYLKATESFQALLKYVAEHIETQQSSETITGLYLQLAGEIWDAHHQKAETENKTSDNAENVEASETVPDADALPKQEGESPS